MVGQAAVGQRAAAVLATLVVSLFSLPGVAFAEPPARPTTEPTAQPTAQPGQSVSPRARPTAQPTAQPGQSVPPRARPTAQPTPPVPSALCSLPVVPPPPVDTSEQLPPGVPTPEPLPVPISPVGGPRMGECGLVLPPGVPPPPAGVGTASWVLADLNSGAVLAARSPHARERPASLIKVLTALVVLRGLDLDKVVSGTLADANVTGSRVGVGPGGRYTVRQLLTGLLLNSGNDAANALSRQLGGVPTMLRAMSETAAQHGALDTRPATPSGLDAAGMASSAYDLALLYRVAMRDPTFAEINRTRQFTFPGHGDRPGFMISNDNRLLSSYPGTIGGKTGFTDDARHTLIVAAERNKRRLVVVLMRGENRPVPMDQQAARLLDYGFALPAGTPPVGTLVDRRPAGPVTRVDQLAPGRPIEGQESRENRLASLAVIGGGALLGALLSVLIARRRPAGQHVAGGRSAP